MYRFSKYAREYTIDDIHVFYSMATDSIVTVSAEIFNIIAHHTNDLREIGRIHPDLFDRLRQAKILIKTEVVDEATEIIKNWKNHDANPEHLKITIIPTLQCNLRCWYCYENHDTTLKISKDTIQAIKLYIEHAAQRESIKKIIVDFFGGEPLLCFDTCVKPIVLFAEQICNKYSKSLGIAFTTNGVLLTTDKCDFLAGINATTSFQITLDGDEKEHNGVRFLKGGMGTYNTIINNILYSISKKHQVTIRFNYTHKNHSSYKQTIEELLNKFGDNVDKSLIDFSFHKVWQEKDSTDIESSMSSHRHSVAEEGYDYNIPINSGSLSRCYADNPNDVVINHDGLVYKCTARDFTPEQAEGVLKPDGTIKWNNRHLLRREIMYGTEHCQKCNIFPICHGGCSQNRLEHSHDSDNCFYNYTEEQKEFLVRNRAVELLQQYLIKTTNN